MKAPSLPIFLLFAFLFAGGPAQASTNLADVVLAEGRFQLGEAEVKRALEQTLGSALLVVKATVLNSNTAVRESPKQPKLSAGQGWAAAVLQTTHVLKGDQGAGTLLVNNLALRENGPHWRRPVETTNGQACILVLQKDTGLSRLCRTNVYTVMRGLEVR